MRSLIKLLAARLPLSIQQELKRYYFAGQIKRGNFISGEKEFKLVRSCVRAGDWVLDIGANVGHYTRLFSELVGPTGRVIAVEPVPRTFELLSANVQLFPCQNVTLLNVAASDECQVVGMRVPVFDSALSNYYQAHITRELSDIQVLTMALDSLVLPHAIKLVKIDAEGHEPAVLKGMRNLLQRDRPTLVVEDNSAEIAEFVRPFGYEVERLAESSNVVFWPRV